MFDLVAQCPLRLIQRHLIAIECRVIAPRYLGLGYGPASLALFQRLKQRCKAVGGQYTLLWYNSHFTTAADRELYRHLGRVPLRGVNPEARLPRFESKQGGMTGCHSRSNVCLVRSR
jgi:GNAT superfamily N-acetyltransferase